jgi:hypothetical protein
LILLALAGGRGCGNEELGCHPLLVKRLLQSYEYVNLNFELVESVYLSWWLSMPKKWLHMPKEEEDADIDADSEHDCWGAKEAVEFLLTW